MLYKLIRILPLILINLGIGSMMFSANARALYFESTQVPKEAAIVYAESGVVNDFRIQNKQAVKSVLPKVTSTKQKTCSGSWFKTTSMNYKVYLDETNYDSWSASSKPSFVKSTKDDSNTVILGHNPCTSGNCNNPLSTFSQIIKAKTGEQAEACMDGKYFEGKVVFSKNVSKYATYVIENNWQGGNIFTALTCYGKCEDEFCSSTQERWVMSFGKD